MFFPLFERLPKDLGETFSVARIQLQGAHLVEQIALPPQTEPPVGDAAARAQQGRALLRDLVVQTLDCANGDGQLTSSSVGGPKSNPLRIAFLMEFA